MWESIKQLIYRLFRREPKFDNIPGARRDVYLAADDRADALGETGAVKRDRAVHHAMVGDGERRLPQLLGAVRQLLDAAGAVKQRVFRMHVQMDKAHGSVSFVF